MPIWMQKVDIETLNNIGINTHAAHIGIEFVEIGDDFLRAKMPVDQRTLQPAGLLHGGASMSLVETMGSVASVLCVDFTKKNVVGIEINGNHLSSARSGFVIGKVTPVKIGKRLHVWSIEIRDQEDKLINQSRLTTMILDK